MKISVALLSCLSLAVALSACQHKSSKKSGSGDRANAEDAEAKKDLEAEAGEDAEDQEKTDIKPKNVVSESEKEGEEPNNGAGEEDEPKEELCYKADAQICQIELKILELVNKERAAPTKSGGGGFFGGGGSSGPKAALAHGKKLGFIAREWSVVQGQRNSIGHDGFPNQRRADFQQEFNASAQMGGENVAMFGGRGGSVEQVARQFYDMWYNSSGHYQNMMGNFQAMGVGVANVNGSWWATQIFGRE